MACVGGAVLTAGSVAELFGPGERGQKSDTVSEAALGLHLQGIVEPASDVEVAVLNICELRVRLQQLAAAESGVGERPDADQAKKRIRNLLVERTAESVLAGKQLVHRCVD